MRLFNKYFLMRSAQRSGLIWLLTVLTALLLYKKYSLYEPSARILDETTMNLMQQHIDSLKSLETKKVSGPYPFNPNFISDYRAYMLGIPTEAYDRLRAFREAGGWINSVDDFKRVTKVPDSVLDMISPYFRFPEWIKKRSQKGKFTSSVKTKIDLNNATVAQLQEVYGVGEVLSKRIVDFRERSGGFSSLDQLYAIYGLSPVVIQRIRQQFYLDQTPVMARLNVNTISASDLSTIPGVSFELGRRIWEYVRLREGIEDLSHLVHVDGVDSLKLRLFAVYLFAE